MKYYQCDQCGVAADDLGCDACCKKLPKVRSNDFLCVYISEEKSLHFCDQACFDRFQENIKDQAVTACFEEE